MSTFIPSLMPNCVICRHPITCNDGTVLYIGASDFHASNPRRRVQENLYTHVEVSSSSNEEEPLLKPYVRYLEPCTLRIYEYVPVEVLSQLIQSHGGL